VLNVLQSCHIVQSSAIKFMQIVSIFCLIICQHLHILSKYIETTFIIYSIKQTIYAGVLVTVNLLLKSEIEAVEYKGCISVHHCFINSLNNNTFVLSVKRVR